MRSCERPLRRKIEHPLHLSPRLERSDKIRVEVLASEVPPVKIMRLLKDVIVLIAFAADWSIVWTLLVLTEGVSAFQRFLEYLRDEICNAED
jgi:hypothetical protein